MQLGNAMETLGTSSYVVWVELTSKHLEYKTQMLEELSFAANATASLMIIWLYGGWRFGSIPFSRLGVRKVGHRSKEV